MPRVFVHSLSPDVSYHLTLTAEMEATFLKG